MSSNYQDASPTSGGAIEAIDMDPSSGASFFNSDYKKNADLKQMLDSSKDSLKLEAMKRIIGMVARGRDASDLFPAVVKNVVSKNIEVILNEKMSPVEHFTLFKIISGQEAGLRLSDPVRRRAAGPRTPVHFHFPTSPQGPEPADSSIGPPSALVHSSPRHCSDRHARHSRQFRRYVTVRTENSGPCHPQTVQLGPGSERGACNDH